MLIHRVGEYEGDMLFTRESDTFLNYGSFSLSHEFRLHTDRYELEMQPDGLTIYVRYILPMNQRNPA